jgi:hypothetical protein
MTIEKRGSLNAFMFLHLVCCFPDLMRAPSGFARTLLLMEDAEMTPESAQEDSAGRVGYFAVV